MTAGSLRLTVVTYGSEGDTRPLVAVCRGLMEAGHEVLLFAERSTLASARTHGVPAQALAGDIQSSLPMDKPSAELRRRDVVKAVSDSLRVVNASTLAWMQAVAEHARTSHGVLFAGLAAHMARTVAVELDKPAIGLWLQPTTATGDFPSPVFPPLNLPAWLNRQSYRASPEAVIQRLYRRSTEAARAHVFGAAFRGDPRRKFPVLYGFSPHLVPRPVDWPADHQICGHWPLPATDWQPPRALLDFLAAGPAPIYIGFGAVSSFVRQSGLKNIISAIAGRRALFFPGWSKHDGAGLPRNFFVLGDTPHPWLFPQTSMVIHHCGAGTTHTASRAGVPSIPLPVGADQSFWAGRLAALGVAPRYIRATRVNASDLAKMIEFAEGAQVRSRARSLGTAMAGEQGVVHAVQSIEALLGVRAQ